MLDQRESRFGKYMQRATVIGVLGGVLLLSACAPEPGGEVTDKTTESGITGQLPDEGVRSDVMLDDFDPSKKQTELPASFPTDLIALPAAVVIDDAGEYDASRWFLVLRAESLIGAEELLNAVITANAFENAPSEKGEDGSIAGTLTNTQLIVEYVSLPAEDGAALLSLVITRA